MEILLNGEPHQAAENTTLAQLLEQNGYGQRRIAVEINREIIPRSRHADTHIQPHDRVEIVQAMGGG